MDFVSGLPCRSSGYDANWVIVDRLTKIVHFLPIKKIYSTDRLAILYISWIVYLHGVPVSIVFDRGATFTSVFGNSCIRLWVLYWTSVQPFILKLMVSLKRAIQTFEDMLRMCNGFWWSMGHTFAID